MSAIAELAHLMLDEQELKLADHLSVLLADDEYDAGLVVAAILPKYWEQVGESQHTLPPRAIYRCLYYVDADAGLINFADRTRNFLDNVCAHIEGCLFLLYEEVSGQAESRWPFGPLVLALRKQGTLSDELASRLLAFNKIVNVPSKHFNAHFLPSALDERTFSVAEAAYAFMMMRKLSVPLFALLKEKGVEMKADWPPFDPRWQDWSPLISERRREKAESSSP
jgi:hypothetical protein